MIVEIALAALVLAALRDQGGSAGAGAVRLPEKAQYLASLIAKWAKTRQIPADVLAAWIKLEADFSPKTYNPEPSAMKSWACEVADDPRTWSKNPDYENAVSVCAELRAGASPTAIGSRFLFGSYGLMQVARPFSPGHGYAAHLPNAGLFDPDTNLKVGTAEIESRRSRLYGIRKNLTDSEWSAVRAAYVMGTSGYLRDPNGATAQGRKRAFLEVLEQLRQAATRLAV